jgi:hypothetical protein
MRDNVFDELLADYAGIVAACGEFRSDWFLRFVGLEDPCTYRAGGRLENYLGDPPLSSDAFQVLCTLLRKAAKDLQTKHNSGHPEVLLKLARATLEQVG